MTDDEKKAMQDTMLYGVSFLKAGERIDPMKVVVRTGLPEIYWRGLNRSEPQPTYGGKLSDYIMQSRNMGKTLKLAEGFKAGFDLSRQGDDTMAVLLRRIDHELNQKLIAMLCGVTTKKDGTMNGYSINPATNGGYIVSATGAPHRDGYPIVNEFAGSKDECLKYVGDKFAEADAKRAEKEAEKARQRELNARVGELNAAHSKAVDALYAEAGPKAVERDDFL